MLETVCENGLYSVGGRSLRFRETFAPCYATGGCYRRNTTGGSIKRSIMEKTTKSHPARGLLVFVCGLLVSSLIFLWPIFATDHDPNYGKTPLWIMAGMIALVISGIYSVIALLILRRWKMASWLGGSMLGGAALLVVFTPVIGFAVWAFLPLCLPLLPILLISVSCVAALPINRQARKNAGIMVGAVLVAAFLGLASKVLYFGVRQVPVGKVGDHTIVFYWTWNSLGSLLTNDGREGYYRIYNQDSQKVFELFTHTYAFDIVLPGEKDVEFQLDTVKSVFWPPRE